MQMGYLKCKVEPNPQHVFGDVKCILHLHVVVSNALYKRDSWAHVGMSVCDKLQHVGQKKHYEHDLIYGASKNAWKTWTI
jgi:hypothetical protein